MSSPRLRILADDLTGALDCAAAFGAGAPVHLARPARDDAPGLDLVATATRDVPVTELPALLAPSLAWLRGADLAFKKVDSLLRGNTVDEIDWLARQGGFAGLAVTPAFPAQGRITEDGQQWWLRADGTRTPVADSLREALRARGWQVHVGPQPPEAAGHPVAWVPDVRSDEDMDAVAAVAAHEAQAAGPGASAPAAAPRWLWCGSAGLAHALARTLGPLAAAAGTPAHEGQGQGEVMLASASHHAVSREQWRQLGASARAAACRSAEDPSVLVQPAAGYPMLLDLSAHRPLHADEAAALLARQAQAIAAHAPRPRTLVVVGGDTLLALCRALGASGLRSGTPLARAGWGCAHMVGGRWDGLVCHTRSGAFGGPLDLVQVLDALGAATA